MEVNYKEIARQARIKVLEMIYKAQTSHIGSNFSCIDIMAVLFEKIDLYKDKFILSKGWAAASLYYFLWKKGRITEEELDSYCQEGSKFIGLAEPVHPDIPFAGGSMGYGLPAGVGFALAKKLKGEEGKVYVLMSDGEMQIGTTWESALIAAHHKLDNLVVIVDYNHFQAMGKTNEILNIEPLVEKWKAFGWGNIRTDGHNFDKLNVALKYQEAFRKPDAPYIIITHTVKGKGVSFMENDNRWHYLNISKEDYEKAKDELDKGI